MPDQAGVAIALDSAVWVPSGKVGAALPGAGIHVRVSGLVSPLQPRGRAAGSAQNIPPSVVLTAYVQFPRALPKPGALIATSAHCPDLFAPHDLRHNP